ncbi:SRPBCC family protein [Luteolibacter arcticus]|uniref:SRPBCC family protein n=1 Tax=Luteolibacter arcticus TaxID=1581411 RepID=A0ABT3GEU4_9BACT|nr:SRPBCC family protein [Luteolibacter arcticus]MCW1922125.1 SRPBCC family protein [Luteolibacter arcticus]
MTDTSAPGIVSTRLILFPRNAVFDAFRDPARLAFWWGPNGFTSTIHEFDLRPGGRFRLTLHGPDGANYENDKEFLEVVEPERVVFRHSQPMHDFTMTITWEEEAGGTRLTWKMAFEPAAAGEKIRDFILKANEENFDRLENHLKSTP